MIVGGVDTNALKQRCIDLKVDETAAIAAADWGAVERIARRRFEQCRAIVEVGDASSSLERVVIARLELGKVEAALRAADECIDFFYSNAGCHVNRAVALRQLARTLDAKAELDSSQRLVEHLRDALATRRQSLLTGSLEDQLAEAELMKLDAAAKLIRTYAGLVEQDIKKQQASHP